MLHRQLKWEQQWKIKSNLLKTSVLANEWSLRIINFMGGIKFVRLQLPLNYKIQIPGCFFSH